VKSPNRMKWRGIWFRILGPHKEKARFPNCVRVLMTTAVLVIEGQRWPLCWIWWCCDVQVLGWNARKPLLGLQFVSSLNCYVGCTSVNTWVCQQFSYRTKFVVICWPIFTGRQHSLLCRTLCRRPVLLWQRCLSVWVSHSSIVSKRRKLGLRNLYCQLAYTNNSPTKIYKGFLEIRNVKETDFYNWVTI